ncbi:GntR family transcriptional regulator [Stella humosa]|uniref:GntR family transcriptional regulator n=1 Tax=Stella humosa TaxID=94 RepID=A0A3N1KVU3_9PROT|nr:GntR family transcriptional regulator [Stella humosa]ROP83377.1 GntR family transcriptional regulator [Stella humosa]BBK29839.1 transcriptional regulator [Stella humosa]
MASGLAGATQFGQRGAMDVQSAKTTLPGPPRTRADRLREDLAEEILSGRLGPGVRLDEQGLADRYGVSRTPVREALRQLAATGLVEARPHKGVVVTTPSPKVLAESFEVMAELEAACAALAARRMPAGLRRSLARVHGRLRLLADAGDPEDYAALNLEFHDLIWQGCGNATLAAMTADVRRRVGPFRRLQFRLAGRLQRSWEEHDAVVQAILAGDPAAARAAMLGHVGLVGDASADLVRPGALLAAME